MVSPTEFIGRRHLWAGGSPGGVRKSMVQLGTHRKKPQDFKSLGNHRTMIHLPGFNIPLWLGKSNSILLDKSALTQRVDNKLYANRQVVAAPGAACDQLKEKPRVTFNACLSFSGSRQTAMLRKVCDAPFPKLL
jgi:hypothetical protein